MEVAPMPDHPSQVKGHKHAQPRQGKSRSTSAKSRAQSGQPEEQHQRGRSAIGLAADALVQAGKMQGRTQGAIEEQRRHVAGRVTLVRDVLLEASERLRSEHEAAARYLERAGRGAEDVAQYISTADLHSVHGDVQRLARAKPAWLVGGALVAGLVIGRLVKASSPSVLSQAKAPR
jgi:hypothetical protein